MENILDDCSSKPSLESEAALENLLFEGLGVEIKIVDGRMTYWDVSRDSAIPLEKHQAYTRFTEAALPGMLREAYGIQKPIKQGINIHD